MDEDSPEERFERALSRLMAKEEARTPSRDNFRRSFKVQPPVGTPNTPDYNLDALNLHTSLQAKGNTSGNASQPACRPWDRSDLFRRLSSFKSSTWFARPQTAGPAACAKHGWMNADCDLLACETCGARLSFCIPPSWTRQQVSRAAGEFASRLKSAHRSFCPWQESECADSLLQFPPQSPAALVEGYMMRCHDLAHSLSALPVVAEAAVSKMTSACPNLIGRLLSPNEPAGPNRSTTEGCKDMRGKVELAKSQRLIAVCGWEPQSLAEAVAAAKQPNESFLRSKPQQAMVDYSAVPRNSGEAAAGRSPLEPSSAILHCSMCGASVGLWSFSTLPFGARGHHILPSLANVTGMAQDVPQQHQQQLVEQRVDWASSVPGRDPDSPHPVVAESTPALASAASPAGAHVPTATAGRAHQVSAVVAMPAEALPTTSVSGSASAEAEEGQNFVARPAMQNPSPGTATGDAQSQWTPNFSRTGVAAVRGHPETKLSEAGASNGLPVQGISQTEAQPARGRRAVNGNNGRGTTAGPAASSASAAPGPTAHSRPTFVTPRPVAGTSTAGASTRQTTPAPASSTCLKAVAASPFTPADRPPKVPSAPLTIPRFAPADPAFRLGLTIAGGPRPTTLAASRLAQPPANRSVSSSLAGRPVFGFDRSSDNIPGSHAVGVQKAAVGALGVHPSHAAASPAAAGKRPLSTPAPLMDAGTAAAAVRPSDEAARKKKRRMVPDTSVEGVMDTEGEDGDDETEVQGGRKREGEAEQEVATVSFGGQGRILGVFSSSFAGFSRGAEGAVSETGSVALGAEKSLQGPVAGSSREVAHRAVQEMQTASSSAVRVARPKSTAHAPPASALQLKPPLSGGKLALTKKRAVLGPSDTDFEGQASAASGDERRGQAKRPRLVPDSAPVQEKEAPGAGKSPASADKGSFGDGVKTRNGAGGDTAGAFGEAVSKLVAIMAAAGGKGVKDNGKKALREQPRTSSVYATDTDQSGDKENSADSVDNERRRITSTEREEEQMEMLEGQGEGEGAGEVGAVGDERAEGVGEVGGFFGAAGSPRIHGGAPVAQEDAIRYDVVADNSAGWVPVVGERGGSVPSSSRPRLCLPPGAADRIGSKGGPDTSVNLQVAPTVLLGEDAVERSVASAGAAARARGLTGGVLPGEDDVGEEGVSKVGDEGGQVGDDGDAATDKAVISTGTVEEAELARTGWGSVDKGGSNGGLEVEAEAQEGNVVDTSMSPLREGPLLQMRRREEEAMKAVGELPPCRSIAGGPGGVLGEVGAGTGGRGGNGASMRGAREPRVLEFNASLVEGEGEGGGEEGVERDQGRNTESSAPSLVDGVAAVASGEAGALPAVHGSSGQQPAEAEASAGAAVVAVGISCATPVASDDSQGEGEGEGCRRVRRRVQEVADREDSTWGLLITEEGEGEGADGGQEVEEEVGREQPLGGAPLNQQVTMANEAPKEGMAESGARGAPATGGETAATMAVAMASVPATDVSETPAQEEVPAALSGMERPESVTPIRAFDPLQSHRHFCPWVSLVSSATSLVHPTNVAAAAGSRAAYTLSPMAEAIGGAAATAIAPSQAVVSPSHSPFLRPQPQVGWQQCLQAVVASQTQEMLSANEGGGPAPSASNNRAEAVSALERLFRDADHSRKRSWSGQHK